MESDEDETTLGAGRIESGNAQGKVCNSGNASLEEAATSSLLCSSSFRRRDDLEESLEVGAGRNWCESDEHCYLHNRSTGDSSLDREQSLNSETTAKRTTTVAGIKLASYYRESLEMWRNNSNTSSRKCTRRRLDVYWLTWTVLIFLLLLSEQGTLQQRNTSVSSGSTRQRWSKYQTALSNTGPLGEATGESDTGLLLFNGESSDATGTYSPTAPTSPDLNSNSSRPSVNNNGGGGPSSSGGRNETGKHLFIPSTTSASSVITRHQHQQQTRSVTSSRGVNSNINNSGSVSTYNNNRNNNGGKMGSGGNPAPSSSAARKRIYEDLGHKFTDGALFENNTSVNITVPLGDTAFLRCRVRNLGERSISWIRRRDWHILTTGKTTYTNDERFHVLHTEGTDDWTLQIKFVQQRDNGTYECQISTGTGIISFMVNLLIAVPEAFILGNGDEYHVEQGSTINLVCVIEKSPKVPEFIFWYHNDRMINYGSSREVTVRTEPGARTQSRLTIRDARISDSGNYTCKTAHAEPASIFVYVSQASGLFSGDKIAAIQRRKSSSSSGSSGSSSSTSSASSSTGHHLLFGRRRDEESSSNLRSLFVHWLTTKMTRMSESFPLFLVISQSLVSSALLSSSTLPSLGTTTKS